MTPAQQKQLSFALVDLYVLCYKDKTGRKPTVNRFREKWGFQDMVDSIGYDRSVEIVKYYFETQNNWTPNHLFNNFDKLDEALTKRDADRARREALREETRRRVEEWDKTHG
jgi:hypothetical protein